jgi:molybdenum cofactor biosynthesis enzyme MoaA
MMKDALVVDIRDTGIVKKRIFTAIFPCSFSFCAWIGKHLVESDGASRLCLCCTSLFDLLGSTTRVGAQKGIRMSSHLKVKGDILHRARTSKLNQTLVHSKMIFSGALGQEGYTSAQLRS